MYTKVVSFKCGNLRQAIPPTVIGYNASYHGNQEHVAGCRLLSGHSDNEGEKRRGQTAYEKGNNGTEHVERGGIAVYEGISRTISLRPMLNSDPHLNPKAIRGASSAAPRASRTPATVEETSKRTTGQDSVPSELNTTRTSDRRKARSSRGREVSLNSPYRSSPRYRRAHEKNQKYRPYLIDDCYYRNIRKFGGPCEQEICRN